MEGCYHLYVTALSSDQTACYCFIQWSNSMLLYYPLIKQHVTGYPVIKLGYWLSSDQTQCYWLTRDQTACYCITSHQTVCYWLTSDQTACYWLSSDQTVCYCIIQWSNCMLLFTSDQTTRNWLPVIKLHHRPTGYPVIKLFFTSLSSGQTACYWLTSDQTACYCIIQWSDWV